MGFCTIYKIIRLHKNGNVCITGLRGCGKDMLTANVIARRGKPYISNIDYGCKALRIPLDFDALDCGKNNYENLIIGNVKPYVFPYEMGADIYLSDGGIYLPSQYCNELNRKYPYIATYQALSRQLSRNNFHFNTQNLNRMYDKVREQSDQYVRATFCKVFFGFVLQHVVIYDKYDSCVARVKPCKIRVPFLNAVAKMQARTYRDSFENVHGSVRGYWLVYRNKSKYDTYHFYNLFKNGGVVDDSKA